MPHDILNHHHRAIYHHAEVEGTKRQQVCRNVPQIQTDGGEQQCEGNGQRYDKCAANIAQQNENNDNDQDHSFGEIVEDGVRRVIHQVVAVEVRDDFHSRWKYVVVELLDHCVDTLKHLRGVCSFAEKHNTFHHVVIVLDHAIGPMDCFPNLAETDLWPLRDDSYVFYS